MDAPYARLETLEPGIARVLAHNPSAFTYYGTQTYLAGEREVAVIDREWATVGSSNLDPLSLSLNLEANVFVRDGGFAGALHQRLQRLLHEDCQRVDESRVPPWRPWHVLTRPLLFHFLRRFPAWAGLLPAHAPATELMEPAPPETPR